MRPTPHPSPLTPFRWLCLAMAALVALQLLGAIAKGQGPIPALDVGGWRPAAPAEICRPGDPCYRQGNRGQGTGDRGQGTGKASPHPAVARILVECDDGSRSGATGTLVAKDDRRGIVVTCWHAFREGNRGTTCMFRDGLRYEATVLKVDELWDLAALEIAPPRTEPAAIAADFARPGDPLVACGYEQSGQYTCGQGTAVGYVTPIGSDLRDWLRSTAPVRPGYSGGPAFNGRGELVAVTWGGDAGYSTATTCGRVRSFLGKLLGRGRPGPGADPPSGRIIAGPPGPEPDSQPVAPGREAIPLPGPGPEEPSPREIAENPLAPIEPDGGQGTGDRGQGAFALNSELAKLAEELEAAQKADADREAAVASLGEELSTLGSQLSTLDSLGEELSAAVSEPRLRALVGEIASGLLGAESPAAPAAASMLPVVLTALGVSFPPGLAALGIAWLARRGVKRLEKSNSRNRPAGKATLPRHPRQQAPASADRLAGIEAALGSLLGRLGPPDTSAKKEEPKPAAAGATFPGVVPRDDGEAIEFLRLSELEGRSPLHDALVGRVAFDELANVAESGGPQAAWAADLKRTLEQRFNEMAPVGIGG